VQTFDGMIGPTIRNCAEYLESEMRKIIDEYARTYPQIGNFFSGGVDSSFVQAHLTHCLGSGVPTFSVDLMHSSWRREHEYSRSGSELFKSHHTFAKVDPSDYPSLLTEATAQLGEPICNAQLVFVPELSRVASGVCSACLCGMAADTLFGTETLRRIDMSLQIKTLIPWSFLRQMIRRMVKILGKTPLSSDWLRTFQKAMELDLVNVSSPAHPFNTSERTNLELAYDIFGKKKIKEAVFERSIILQQYQTTGSLKELLHSLYLLRGHRASERFYQLASSVGLRVIFPYLDSRMVKVALSMDANCRFRSKQTKRVIKDALSRYLPEEFIHREKSSWGVPIFEWLRGGGVLYELVEKMNEYQFLKGKGSTIKNTQDWFLWNFLTFDLWHKLFIDPAQLS
jgi:asparagine synthase (glutamine-hydrolysing)